MKHFEFVQSNHIQVLEFLKSRFPMYHLSNFFFREVQYGIQMMMEERGVRVGYGEAEKMARAFVEKLEKEKIFTMVDRQTWVVNYPQFKKPQSKPAAASKSTAPAKAADPAPAAPGGVVGKHIPASEQVPAST